MIREGIQKLIEGSDLTFEESREVMYEVMSGNATSSQTAAFLTALRMKGETVEELIAFASIMRANCCTIHPKVKGRLVDTCGTGGDKIKTFNVSTAAAFVIAGAGISVAKHGNRAVTSLSGSADVLEKLGLNLKMEAKTVQSLIEKIGIGFMFAPAFHPAMKYAAEPRREIGFRTVFNLLGPLTNPACANAQLLGVYDVRLVKPIAHVLQKLGCEEAMIVHGLEGLDEVSTVGKTVISHLKNGKVKMEEYFPRDFGFNPSSVDDLKISASEKGGETLFKILRGRMKNDPKTDFVLANSAAGIIVGGKAESFKEAIAVAQRSIENGEAYSKLKNLVVASGGNVQILEELERKYE
jgi:anthranilate phosphoribosyltransferase